jgi:hypothetical protein
MVADRPSGGTVGDDGAEAGWGAHCARHKSRQGPGVGEQEGVHHRSAAPVEVFRDTLGMESPNPRPNVRSRTRNCSRR